MGRVNKDLLKAPAILAVVALIVAGGVVGGVGLANGASAANRAAVSTNDTISVTGTGVVTGRPNTLTVQMGVSTSASSATAALDQNNAEMTNLETTLVGAGVKWRDLQTSNLQISPNYDAQGVITSYGVNDDLTATFHHITRSGAVIDAAAHAVGNDIQIQGISFSITGTSALVRTARMQAVQNAQQEASDIASGAHASLGSILRITDQEQQTTPPTPYLFANGAAAKSAVPLQPGTEQLSVQVAVVFGLRS